MRCGLPGKSLAAYDGSRAAGSVPQAALLCVVVFFALSPASAEEEKSGAKSLPSSTPTESAEKPSPAEEESKALAEALETTPGDTQALIKNLEAFLARFPDSSRREQVLRTIYKLAVQSNDPRKAIAAAEQLLELDPENPDLLTAILGQLERQNDEASREKALHYATRFVERAEKAAKEPPPADTPAEKWRETAELMRATAYFLRAQVHARSGDHARAVADFETSLAAYPTAHGAEQLGDVASHAGDVDRAIKAYATAFAFPDNSLEPSRRDQIRRKLGSAYVSKHHSEDGLGDLILARYDELSRLIALRLKTGTRPNAGISDPYEYVLERLEGGQVRLAEYRGKVVVMDFWATWCAPCRLEGRLFEQVMESFRDNPSVAFLAVNVDEDRSGVAEFVKEENWKTPVVYAEGLDLRLDIRALPTVLVMDGEGRVIFRQAGLNPVKFGPTLEAKIREALANRVAAVSTQ